MRKIIHLIPFNTLQYFILIGLLLSGFMSCQNKTRSLKATSPGINYFASGRFDSDTIPHDQKGDFIRYGYQLITHTSSIIGPNVKNMKMRFSGNNLACVNCHLESGQKKFSAPFVGVTGRFPQFRKRANTLATIEERINGCMQRSMNGRKLPADSKEMIAIVAYMQWLSRDVPSGQKIQGSGFLKITPPDRKADLNHGKQIFLNKCSSCHGKSGQGKMTDSGDPSKGYDFPPLWGPDSFNQGAGMHRVLKAASFIKGNMPFGTTYQQPQLTDAEAYDVAAYINSKTRPDKKGKKNDYPDLSLKPVDCPYPPYADHFSQEQHQFGPFQPITNARRHH